MEAYGQLQDPTVLPLGKEVPLLMEYEAGLDGL